MKEVQELNKEVTLIAVKDKLKKWEPSPKEAYPIICNGVKKPYNRQNKCRL